MPHIETSDRIKIYYEDEGQGQPILLIHGWLISSQSWRRQRPVLSKTHRVISVDMRSHGKSDKPSSVFIAENAPKGELIIFENSGHAPTPFPLKEYVWFGREWGSGRVGEKRTTGNLRSIILRRTRS